LDWKDSVAQFVPILVLSLATTGSVAFLFIAEFSGFDISILLFALPVVAFLTILVVSRISFRFSPMAARFRKPLVIIVLLVSATLRLIVVFYASYYPDEYNTWAIFRTNPWGNLLDFLRNYPQIAGAQVVHPPLGFLLMSLGFEALHSLEAARLVSVVAGLLSIPVVYWLISMLIDRPTALYATLIFSLMPQTVIFLSLALTDAYVLLFGLLSLTTFLSSIKNRRRDHLLASGILLGLTFWSKAAIPFLWAFIIFLSAYFSGWTKRRESMMRASFCFLVGVSIYGLWYLISPISFLASANLLPRILQFGRYNIGSVESPITGLPSIANAGLSTISLFDLLLQLPAWLTPLIIIFASLGVYISLRSLDRQTLWIVLWAIIPMLALVFYYRDIRYLLISSVPIAAMVLIGLKHASKRKTILAIVLVFLAVGSISFIPIVQQEYAGIHEASEVINSLGLSNQTILSNALPIRLFLPHAQLIYLSPYNDTVSVHDLLNTKHVAAAVMIHQRRGAWGGEPSHDVMGLIHGYFNQKIEGGLSDFSWYEVLYSSQAGNPPSQVSAIASVTMACAPSLYRRWENSVTSFSGNSNVDVTAIPYDKLRAEFSGVRN